MQVVVDNTTTPVAGEATATITRVFLNLPPNAINAASLTSQAGSGGATPAFWMAFDADTNTAPNTNAIACLGDFNIYLDAGNGSHGAIANAAALVISTPNAVLGPVTFDIQLAGPGVAGITADAILASFSLGGSHPTNVGLKFQGGGVGGQESGFVGSGDKCRMGIYTVGNTSIGQSFDICVTGDYGCHVCLWASTVPGPVLVQGIVIPIGLPLLGVWDLGNIGLGGIGNSSCLPVNVPNNPLLSGYTLYLTNITYDALNVTGYQFSEAYELTIN